MPPKKRPIEDDTPAAGKRAAKTRRTGKKQTKKTQKPRPAMTLGPGERYSDFESDSEESVRNETVRKPAAKTPRAAKKQKKKGPKARPAMTLGPGERYSDFESDSEQSVHSETSGLPDLVEGSASGSNKKSQDNADKDEHPMDKKDPYEYILMRRPLYDFEEENNTRSDKEELDEEELEKEWEKHGEEIPHDTASSEKPDHKWILMRGAWIYFADSMRERGYRSPDALGMYIYNDFEGYGLLEMVENSVQAFATKYVKKDANLKDMWVTIVGFIHFFQMAGMTTLGMIDDGQRLTEVVTLVGRAYLAMLNSLDRAGQLGSDSEFKDLGLVTALYMRFASYFPDSYDSEELDWKVYVQDYAEAHKVDTSFVFGSPEITFADENDDVFDDREGIPKAGADRWGFKKAFKKYKTQHSANSRTIGGTQFDITKMTRSERARYAFDKKDPLKDVPQKDLKEGNIMIR